MKRVHQKTCRMPALLLNISTFSLFVFPRVNLAATTLSGWGFNLLALIQLVMLFSLIFRLFKKESDRS